MATLRLLGIKWNGTGKERGGTGRTLMAFTMWENIGDSFKHVAHFATIITKVPKKQGS